MSWCEHNNLLLTINNTQSLTQNSELAPGQKVGLLSDEGQLQNIFRRIMNRGQKSNYASGKKRIYRPKTDTNVKKPTMEPNKSFIQKA